MNLLKLRILRYVRDNDCTEDDLLKRFGSRAEKALSELKDCDYITYMFSTKTEKLTARGRERLEDLIHNDIGLALTALTLIGTAATFIVSLC